MEDSGKKKKVYPIFVIVCTIVCTIACIYGVLYVVLFASAFESVQKSREQSIQMDCDIALLPDLAGLIDRQGSKDGYSVYETRHYKSVEALCEVMPEGFAAQSILLCLRVKKRMNRYRIRACGEV